MATLRERIAAIDEKRQQNDDKVFDRALIKVSVIILAGYIIGTVTGFTLRYFLR